MNKLSEEELQLLAEEKRQIQLPEEQAFELAAYQKVNDFLQKEESPVLSANFSESVMLRIRQNADIKMGILEWGMILTVMTISLGCIGWALSWSNPLKWMSVFTSLFEKSSANSWIPLFGVLFCLLGWSEIGEFFSFRYKLKQRNSI